MSESWQYAAQGNNGTIVYMQELEGDGYEEYSSPCDVVVVTPNWEYIDQNVIERGTLRWAELLADIASDYTDYGVNVPNENYSPIDPDDTADSLMAHGII